MDEEGVVRTSSHRRAWHSSTGTHGMAYVVAMFLLLVGLGACSGARNGPDVDGEPVASVASTEHSKESRPFDSARAWGHVDALAAIEDRHTGTRGAKKARRYIRHELERSDFEIREVEIELPGNSAAKSGKVTATHVVGVLEGEAPGVLVMAARYDTRPVPNVDFRGANDGASGAAVLLELARAFSDERPPFGVWLAFVDGDGRGTRTADAPVAELYPGSDGFAGWLAAQPEADRVRLLVFLNRVGDPDLEIARDLNSNLVHRDVFFAEGRALGIDAFSSETPLSAPRAGHRAIIDRGFRQTVALIDERQGAGSPPGDDWHTERDVSSAVSPQSLGAVGDVTWLSLGHIFDRLSRIDAFREDPLNGGPGQLSLPGSGGDPVGAADGGGAVSRQDDEKAP